MIFGMWGDPHIGGPSNWQDDLSYFDRDLNMVYAWDEDNRSDVAGRKPDTLVTSFLKVQVIPTIKLIMMAMGL